jgi:transposase
LFQPPYSPDVNPIERVWQFMKDKLRWLNLKNLGFFEGSCGVENGMYHLSALPSYR